MQSASDDKSRPLVVPFQEGMQFTNTATGEISEFKDGKWQPAKPPWRCETCKYWLPLGDFSKVIGYELYGALGGTRGTVCGLTYNYEIYQEQVKSRAVARDAEEFQALLFTDPDYGCVQWEAASDAR